MPISARLARMLRQALGDEAAEDLVSWMEEKDAQRAEERDLIRADFAEVRQEMVAGFARADATAATLRQDVQAGFARADAVSAELRQDMQAGFARADAVSAELRQEMQAGFARADANLAALREEMRLGFAQLEIKLERRFGDLLKWSFVFWVGAVGAIAALAGVLR